MKVDIITPAFSDERGEIIDILKNNPVEYATLITSKKGAVRANHFHKDTYQWVYMVEGRMRIRAQMPSAEIEEVVLNKGELIVNVPHESHAFEALEDSVMLVLTKGPRGGENYEKDTYRLEEPLIAPKA
ncbi:MAG: cupin domain-containing protein [Stellaceae bacterium]